MTGEVTLFATIDSAAQGVASLGGLAFDPRTQQLFVAERGTGLIHRLSLDGTDRGTFDHGADGRPAAGLAPVPLDAAPAVDIGNAAFDTETPATWGFAAPPRRVFGLAVWKDRLYYAVAQGPQVWSVGLGQDGAFTSDVRFEADVPALQDGVEIASIAFDQNRMYLAERGSPTGDYSLSNLASEGASRVLRFSPKPAGDGSPGFWKLTPDEYAIGLAPNFDNANGGVALGYGYQQGGGLDLGACRATRLVDRRTAPRPRRPERRTRFLPGPRRAAGQFAESGQAPEPAADPGLVRRLLRPAGQSRFSAAIWARS